MKFAVVAITRNGAVTGSKIVEALPSAELYVSRRYADQCAPYGSPFEAGELSALIVRLWNEVDGFILIMAAGIVVRLIAPLLQSKSSDPAVVVMDDAARFSISLLSGHLGGANELAERCSRITGSRAVITTATDANQLPSFDMLAKEQGWVIEDLSRVKLLNRLLLDGEEIAVVDPGGRVASWFHNHGRLVFHDSLAAAYAGRAGGVLLVSNRIVPPEDGRENLLILRPRNLVLGIGCNRGTSRSEIETFVNSHLLQLQLSVKSVCCMATAAAKRDEQGLLDLAQSMAVPLTFFESAELNSVAVPSAPSRHALAAIGASGVAEPAAVLASGGGRLLLQKVKSENVTLAVAEKKEETHDV